MIKPGQIYNHRNGINTSKVMIINVVDFYAADETKTRAVIYKNIHTNEVRVRSVEDFLNDRYRIHHPVIYSREELLKIMDSLPNKNDDYRPMFTQKG